MKHCFIDFDNNAMGCPDYFCSDVNERASEGLSITYRRHDISGNIPFERLVQEE
jgi:hypothetical protein